MSNMEIVASLGEQLDYPPNDGVTSVQFASVSDQLLATSWDGTVRLYNGPKGELSSSLDAGAPVLSACFDDSDSACFSGGLDGIVKRFDFTSGEHRVIGRHDKAVRCIAWIPSLGLVASASWDASLRLWDPRAAEGSNCAGLARLPGKAYAMGVGTQRLVVGTSNRHVEIFNLSTIRAGKPDQSRESPLKYQTRALAVFPDGRGYALSSVEGRVAMEYFEPEDVGLRFAFKCHRRQEDGQDVVYPVNAIAFHPPYGTFATGGSDGVFNVWDGASKKRLTQVSGYPSGVSALAFNRDGSLLAVAASYSYERGEDPVRQQPDTVYVRRMADSEVRPKRK